VELVTASFVFLRGFGVRNVFLLLFRLEWSSQRIGTVKKCLAFFYYFKLSDAAVEYGGCVFGRSLIFRMELNTFL
jgi:hypothetical protein